MSTNLLLKKKFSLSPSPGPQIVKPQNVMVKGVYLTYNQSPLVKLLDFEMFTSCHFFLLL